MNNDVCNGEVSKARILVADDHPIVVEGLCSILSGINGCEVIGQAADGAQAVEMALSLRPDVTLMDISFGNGINGLEASRRILTERADARIVMLTVHKGAHCIANAFAIGVKGYVLKDDAVEEIASCIQDVLDGKVYVSARLRTGKLPSSTLDNEDIRAMTAELSARQIGILRCMSEGRTAKEIGAEFGISAKAVEKHREKLKQVFNARNSIEMVCRAQRLGLFLEEVD